jgi:hypothetical protein
MRRFARVARWYGLDVTEAVRMLIRQADQWRAEEARRNKPRPWGIDDHR